MIDPVRNIAVVPASCVFDRFIATLDKVGRLELCGDMVYRFPECSPVDFRKHYRETLGGILTEFSKKANKVVFVDECLPQRCSMHRPFANREWEDDGNVVRWTIRDDIDIPVVNINADILSEAERIVKRRRKTVYFCHRNLPEEYLVSGIVSMFGNRILNIDFMKRTSESWIPVNVLPQRMNDSVQFELRNEALKYLGEKLL